MARIVNKLAGGVNAAKIGRPILLSRHPVSSARLNMDIASTLTHSLLAAQRRRSGLTRKEITISGGLRYAYLEGGQGEPLLMLHGFGANKDNFTPIARYLVPHYRVIIPDHMALASPLIPRNSTTLRRPRPPGCESSWMRSVSIVSTSPVIPWVDRSHSFTPRSILAT